jgi:hypothetical protein
VLLAIGFVIEIQPVSLLTGSSTLWIGLVLAGAGLLVAFTTGARGWLKIAAVAITALCLFNAVDTTRQLEQQREKVRHDLQQISTDLQQFSTGSP